jgi:hypothetical protein
MALSSALITSTPRRDYELNLDLGVSDPIFSHKSARREKSWYHGVPGACDPEESQAPQIIKFEKQMLIFGGTKNSHLRKEYT